MKLIVNGYLQEDLLKHELDLVDVKLIKYFQQFTASKNMRHYEKNGKLYFWLSYQKVIDDLPIINIKSKRTVARRFDDMVEKGIFERIYINNQKNYNNTYFRLTDLHNSMLENINYIFKKDKPKAVVKEPVKKDDVSEMFNKFYKAYPKKLSRGQAEKTFEKLVKEKVIDNDVVDLMVKDLDKRKEFEDWLKDGGQFIPYPSTYLNNKGWLDEYEIKPTGKQDTKDYNGVKPKGQETTVDYNKLYEDAKRKQKEGEL